LYIGWQIILKYFHFPQLRELKERIEKHKGGDFLSTSVNKENDVFVLWTKKEQVTESFVPNLQKMATTSV